MHSCRHIGRNTNYTEGCDEEPGCLRANRGDAVAGRMRKIKHEFHAKRHAATGARAIEPDGGAATNAGAGGNTGSGARSASSNAGTGSGSESGECAGAGSSATTGTARAVSGARGNNVAGNSGDVDQFV